MDLSVTATPQASDSAQQSGLRVVALGGGTGLSTLLRGLKLYVPSSVAPGLPADAPCGISDLGH